jgi:hypothetical protein
LPATENRNIRQISQQLTARQSNATPEAPRV